MNILLMILLYNELIIRILLYNEYIIRQNKTMNLLFCFYELIVR